VEDGDEEVSALLVLVRLKEKERGFVCLVKGKVWCCVVLG
jgi:hypothetical protein